MTTEYVRDCLVQPLLDLPLDRFLVLPCAIDIEAFNAADVPGIRRKYKLPERYVICPGALTAVKGPQNIVAASRAYADLAQTVFIGGGELHDEIERDNTAVGVALAANIIAIGMVAFKAVFGDFVGWTEGLVSFATFAVIGFIVLLVVRLLFDLVLHPKANVAHELAEEQNLGFAFLEGAVVISASLVLFFAI